MRPLALTVLLLAVAGTAGTAFAYGRPAPAARPEASAHEDPAPQWTPSMRAAVLLGCQRAVPDKGICSCVTRQIEQLSPAPGVVTTEAVQTGVQRCRRT